MSRSCVVLLTILAAFAVERAAPADALPLPIPTRVRATRTATPLLTPTPARTATRTPTPTPSATTAARPDMVPEISDVSLQLGATVASGDVAEGCAEATSGVDLLRFSVSSKNIGTADLLLGDPRCPSPCADHPLEVCGNRDFVCSPAAGHNHAHYDNYARYELVDAQGVAVVVGHKQGFCLRDTTCAAPVYTCSYQGISAGCADLYHASLGCQYLDVTGIPAGSYGLRVTIDPLQEIAELSDANNAVQRTVSITRPGERTPTRTATPRATPPPTPPPAATVTAVRTASAVRTAGTPHAGPSATPIATPAVFDGSAAAVCQRAILSAGRTLVGRTRTCLEGCAAAVAGCETPRRRTVECRDRAVAACAEARAQLAAATAAFTSRVTGRCADVGVAELVSDAGLAFGRRAAPCVEDFAAGTATVAEVASCLARQHLCRGGMLLESEDPRIGARLARGGALGAPLCVRDRGAADPAAPELEEGRALAGCSRAIKRAGRQFARHRLAGIQSCLAARAGCLASSTSSDACVRRAEAACAARAPRFAAAATRLELAIARGCGALDFGLVRAERGLHLDAAPECTGSPAGSLAEYGQCLARHHACDVDAMLRFEAPRADEWVGGWPAPAGACPLDGP